MKEFDDNLGESNFDNFQFVNFHEAIKEGNPAASFAMQALMEIPGIIITFIKFEYCLITWLLFKTVHFLFF